MPLSQSSTQRGRRPSEFELGSDGGCNVVIHERRQRKEGEVRDLRKGSPRDRKNLSGLKTQRGRRDSSAESVRDVIEEAGDRVEMRTVSCNEETDTYLSQG